MENYPLIFRTSRSHQVKEPELGLYKKHSKNPIEDVFANKLSEKFPNSIKTNQKLILKYHEYEPDICFINKDLNVFIAIEVDEPYSRSNNPTHFIGDYREEIRNKEFCEHGWTVLRFSEKQVKLHLKECIDLVSLLVNEIAYQNESNDLKYITTLISDRRWTKEEAQIYQSQFLRDFYSYEFIPTLQKDVILLKEFTSLDSYFDEIILKHIPEFDFKIDLIFLPQFISSNYKSIKEGHSMIFVDFISSTRKINIKGNLIKTSTLNPRIKFIDSEDYDIFNFISIKRNENVRIQIKDEKKKMQFYNFLFTRTTFDNSNKNVKLIESF